MFGIESANIVGYAPTTSDGAKAPIIGGQFFACNGGTTFNLADFKVPGSKEWDDGWDCQYMNPSTEFIRVLDTSSLADTARYTYISEEYIIDNIGDLCDEENPDLSPYAWAIGWWRFPTTTTMGPDYAAIIEEGDKSSEYYIGDAPITFPNGTAFVGDFAAGKARQLVSSGAVAVNTFAYNSAGARAPVFGNQLPVSVNLSDLSMPGSKTWDDGWDCQYMNPSTEFIRVLDTGSLADVARYTYISEEYIIDNIGDLCDEEEPDLTPYAWAIGWWRFPTTTTMGPDYASIIEEGDKTSEYYLGDTTINIKAGYGFVGDFATGKIRNIYFPSAINVPSKQ